MKEVSNTVKEVSNGAIEASNTVLKVSNVAEEVLNTAAKLSSELSKLSLINLRQLFVFRAFSISDKNLPFNKPKLHKFLLLIFSDFSVSSFLRKLGKHLVLTFRGFAQWRQVKKNILREEGFGETVRFPAERLGAIAQNRC